MKKTKLRGMMIRGIDSKLGLSPGIERTHNICCKCGATRYEVRKYPSLYKKCYSGYPGDEGTNHIWKYYNGADDEKKVKYIMNVRGKYAIQSVNGNVETNQNTLRIL